MKKTSKTIVFFGSGPVAAESLRLLAQNFNVEAVVTKPRPDHHRGDVPVISVADELNMPHHTVTNKSSLDNLIAEQPFRSTLGVLIDFGIIVSQKVIDYFPMGIINSHFSLLPEWRGADPITFSILSGQKKTGVSLMLLTAGMDEGPLLAQSIYELDNSTTAPALTSDLVDLSHEMLVHIIPLYLADKTQPAPQESATMAASPTPSYSRKLTKRDGQIDWAKSAEEIERQIRAFIDWPKSYTKLGEKDVIITKASVVPQKGEPGTIAMPDKNIVVFCSENALSIEKLKPVGKREMSAQEFLTGYGKNL